MRFIYQVVVSCLKMNIDTQTSIQILNNLIKQNGINYPIISSLRKYDHIKYMVGVHLRKYRNLKVAKSNYNNPRLRGLFYQLQMETEDDVRINQTRYQTDSLVRQELNRILNKTVQSEFEQAKNYDKQKANEWIDKDQGTS